MEYVVYILRCADGTLYTGMTNDLPRRLCAHNSGTGAKYTRARRPVLLFYQEPCGSRSEALRRDGPEGLRVAEFSCGETEYDREADLYRCAAEVLCEAYLYAVADEGGAFLDFEVRGKESI